MLSIIRKKGLQPLPSRSVPHRSPSRSFSMAQVGRNWNANEAFFKFTRGRFVSDEDHQNRQHQIKFDMNELARIVAGCAGAKECLAIEKCPDGLHNKVFVFTLDNGRKMIGKVPNPNAGTPHYTTASEVATLKFLRTVLKNPVPKVYAWSSRKDETPVTAEFIVMEQTIGKPLSQQWHLLQPGQKFRVLRQLCDLQKSWLSIRFSNIGSLYLRDDLSYTEPPNSPALVEEDSRVRDSSFVVGPSTGREWIEHGRQDLQCDRGPWRSTTDYAMSVINRERMAIAQMAEFPKQDVMVCGPTLYTPTKERKLAALEASEKVLPYVLPIQNDLTANHLWDSDLHAENIFVDVEDPTKITGIIDWQSTFIAPLFEQNLEPKSLLDFHSEYDGSLDRPKLPPDIDALPSEERKEVLRQYFDRGLMVAWRQLIQKRNSSQYDAIQFGDSVAGNLIALSRRIYSLGEAHCLLLLLDLKNEWNSLPAVKQAGGSPFPLSFTEAEKCRILDDAKSVDKGIELMQYIAKEFDGLWPEKGLVELDEYDHIKSELHDAKDNLMRHLGLSTAQKEEFSRYWPFDSD